MKAKKLELRNFRNYSSEQIDFCDSINIICGDNGMGKTNIAEAVYYFSHGRSFRSSGILIIKDGEEKAKIRLCFESGERKFDGERRFFGGKKKGTETVRSLPAGSEPKEKAAVKEKKNHIDGAERLESVYDYFG